jgi:hypothetical protein
MTAEWDHSGNADSATISETRVAAGDSSDAYDVDPDVENYAAGNSPETAYRNQGNPDGSNGWSRFVSEGAHEETGEGDYGDGADQYAELDETHGASEAPDLWGDIHPDAANYPGLDSQAAASAEERESPDHRESEPDRDDGADIGQPDQAQLPVADTRRDLSSEQQQISAFEAKVEAKFADMKAEYDSRFEQMRAEFGQVTETASAHDQGDDKPEPSADQPESQDTGSPTHGTALAEHKDTDKGVDTSDAKSHGWRRVTSADNLGFASAVMGAADTFNQIATHVTPEGMVGLGMAVLTLGAAVRAKAEKQAEEKRKAKP